MKTLGIFILITMASFVAVTYFMYKTFGEKKAVRHSSLIWYVTMLLSTGITLAFFY